MFTWFVEAGPSSGGSAATFLQGRVNLPSGMYAKGYYVVGSFQVLFQPYSSQSLQWRHYRRSTLVDSTLTKLAHFKQGSLNLGQVEKCDLTGEFCRVVSRMILTSRGSFDGYLVHYNEKDKPEWGVKMGGDGEDKARALAVDPADGNVVVFGYFSGVARFGHLIIKSTWNRLDCAHGCAVFVVKYQKDGRAMWVKQAGQSTHQGPQACVDRVSLVLLRSCIVLMFYSLFLFILFFTAVETPAFRITLQKRVLNIES